MYSIYKFAHVELNEGRKETCLWPHTKVNRNSYVARIEFKNCAFEHIFHVMTGVLSRSCNTYELSIGG